MIYEFAIKKDILNSGKELFTPVVRQKQKKWWGKIYDNPWERIVCYMGVYFTLELPWFPELTYEQCLEHIKGYQEKLKQDVANDIQTVEFHNLEETIL